MALEAHDCGYRFLVLFFNCLLTFGSYFCFDMPSVLQTEFQGNISCTANNISNSSGHHNASEDCCTDCLGMTADEYNLLYAIYAWTNALVVIGAGVLIDKLGNRFGVFLFSFMCVLGSSTFALGAYFKGTSALLPVMLLGRLLFGSGNGSLTIVQNRITSFWFRDKELALAFGMTLAFSRLGSVLNFFLTQNIEQAIGLQWTLWFGAILCGLGFISAIIVSILDRWGMKQLGQDDSMNVESKKMRITDIRHFNGSFWLLVFAIMFFYNGVFPFVADASKFIQDKYSMDKKTSSYLAGAAYDVSMILSPFLGGVIDIIGKRSILACMCAVLTLPVFGLLAFTDVYPLVSILWLGVTYSFAAASLWPSIPLVVDQATIGTAMGLTTSVQMIGIGLCNLIVGELLGNEKNISKDETLQNWKYVMIFLLCNTVACVLITVLLNIQDRRNGGTLNQSRREKKEASLKNVVDDEADADERTPILNPAHLPPPYETPALYNRRTNINT